MRLTLRHTFFLCFALTCAAFALSPSPSCAASGATSSAGAAATSCDPKFMEALRARAYMEAQREVVTNAATIWKPDSVMQLTCFDQQVGVLLKSGGAGFSEKDTPNEEINVSIGKPGTKRYDRYVLAGASQITQKQVYGNFTIELLGGHPSATSLQYITTPVTASPESFEALAGESCKNMRKVWVVVRCANLDMNRSFPTFDAFASGALIDPRNTGNLKNITPSEGNTIDCAEGYDKQGFDQANTLLNTPGVGSTGFTPASLFASVTAPYSQLKSSSGAQGNCFPGIKTGVMLGSGVEEVVCPNPGCIPKSGTCQPQS